MHLNPELKQAYFDADNTVINVRKSNYEAFVYCNKVMFGIDIHLSDCYKLAEFKFAKSLPIILDKYKIKTSKSNEELINEYLDIRREFVVRPENLELIKPAIGIEKFLKKLKNMRVQTAIVTNSKEFKIAKMLDSVGLLEYFDTIHGNLGDGYFIPKPSPSSLIKAQEKLATTHFSRKDFMELPSLFFGDNLRDGTAVHALNKLRHNEGYKHNMEFVGVDLRDIAKENTNLAFLRLQCDHYIGNFDHIIY
jgi:phosphoglycolate phosphatase-like HAD superfamily hydrolase